MRATIFNAPLELTIDIKGESWSQSDKIAGELSLKSHDPKSLQVSDMSVSLCLGNLKKLKTKDAKTFELLQEVIFDATEISPNNSTVHKFEFTIAYDAPVTCKKESLFIVFGNQNSLSERGNLQLTVTVHPMIQEMVKIFETFFRFQVKEYKNAKGFTEVVFNPPKSSKDFSSLDSFSCLFKYSPDSMTLKYNYQQRVLAADMASATGAKIDKKKKEKNLELNHKDYQMSAGIIDQERAKNHIETSLEELKSKKLF